LVKVPALAEMLIKVSTLTPVAPFLTFGSKVTGSGVGGDGGAGSVEAGEPGGCEPVPAVGATGAPPQAARVVANSTAPAAMDSLRKLLLGINIPMFEVNTAGAPPV
jgi:hypothetical protein